MEKYIDQNGIPYELRGEQYYPLLELPEQKEIGNRTQMNNELGIGERSDAILFGTYQGK